MAIPYLGAGTAIGGQIESTYGTDPAGTPVWLKAVSSSLASTTERGIVDHLVHGDSGEVQDTFEVSRSMGGDLVVKARYQGLGWLLYLALGQIVESGAGPYVHTYSPAVGGLLPSATIYVVRGTSGVQDEFTGCKVASWELAQQQGQIANFRATIIGQDGVHPRPSADTPTYGSGEFLHFGHGPSVTYNAVSYTCQSIALMGDNKLERVDELDLDTAEPAQSAPREYRIRLTLAARSTSLLPAMRAGTSATLTWTLTGATSPNSITVTAQRCQVMSYDDPITAYGVTTQTVEFLARASGSNEAISIAITNATALHDAA